MSIGYDSDEKQPLGTIEILRAQVAALHEGIVQFETHITAIAASVGACCGGVDGPVSDPNSTAGAIIAQVAALKAELVKQGEGYAALVLADCVTRGELSALKAEKESMDWNIRRNAELEREVDRIMGLWGEACSERDRLSGDKAAIYGGSLQAELAALKDRLAKATNRIEKCSQCQVFFDASVLTPTPSAPEPKVCEGCDGGMTTDDLTACRACAPSSEKPAQTEKP